MRLLVLYHAGFTYTPTVHHYLSAISRYSAFDVDYFNVDQSYGGKLDFSAYDAVYINYCVVSVNRIDPPPFMMLLISGLRRYGGVKIASVQDEYDFVNRTKVFLLQIGVDAVLTCVPQVGVRDIYSEPEFDRIYLRTIQTAYLSDELMAVDPAEILPLAERPIALGYRGRALPYRLGDLGWHKTEIADQFKRACARAGVVCDIEVDEEKRFTGEAWLGFVRNCRVHLGTPSGANVFDFDGSLDCRMTERWNAKPGLPYQEVRDELLPYEVAHDMGQVSARIFEAVAQKTALALLRGNYSGVVEPEEHYVPINPDYSNVDDVLKRILDVSAMQEMADRAFYHVLNDTRNRYSYMVSQIDALTYQIGTIPGKQGVSPLKVTAQPLGCDPYLFDKLCWLKAAYQKQVDDYFEFVGLVSRQEVRVIDNLDGSYQVIKGDFKEAGFGS